MGVRLQAEGAFLHGSVRTFIPSYKPPPSAGQLPSCRHSAVNRHEDTGKFQVWSSPHIKHTRSSSATRHKDLVVTHMKHVQVSNSTLYRGVMKDGCIPWTASHSRLFGASP